MHHKPTYRISEFQLHHKIQSRHQISPNFRILHIPTPNGMAICTFRINVGVLKTCAKLWFINNLDLMRRYPNIWEMCTKFVRMCLLVLNWLLDIVIELESRNLLLKTLFVSVVEIWRGVCKNVLKFYEN